MLSFFLFQLSKLNYQTIVNLFQLPFNHFCFQIMLIKTKAPDADNLLAAENDCLHILFFFNSFPVYIRNLL